MPLTNGSQEEIPLPHAAGLVAGVLPFDRASLERSGTRYVIETSDARPSSLRGARPWYRVLLATPSGRLLELTG